MCTMETILHAHILAMMKSFYNPPHVSAHIPPKKFLFEPAWFLVEDHAVDRELIRTRWGWRSACGSPGKLVLRLAELFLLVPVGCWFANIRDTAEMFKEPLDFLSIYADSRHFPMVSPESRTKCRYTNGEEGKKNFNVENLWLIINCAFSILHRTPVGSYW